MESPRQNQSDIDQITNLVKRHIPNGKMVENVGSDVVFCLPEFDGSGLRQRDKFPILFDDLDSNMEQLGVDSYGVSDTTLEEVVFIHVNVRLYLMAFFLVVRYF